MGDADVADVAAGPGGPDGLQHRLLGADLLQSVPAGQSGIASGVFNTSRQVGGALAVAVFGALIASRAQFQRGLRESLVTAAAAAFTAAAANLMAQAQAGRATSRAAGRP